MVNQSISKARYFRNSTFQIGQFARALQELFAEYDAENIAYINIDRDLPDGSHIQDSPASAPQLEQICDFKGQAISIHLPPSHSPLNDIYIRPDVDYFSMEVDAAGALAVQHVFDHFMKDLALVEVESPSQRSERLSKAYPPEKTFLGLIKRVEKLESAVFDPGNRLRCFLSYKFGAESDAVAYQVKKFLELLDIEVVTGEAYEPRRVSDKIVAKLQKDLDLIVLLLTGEGESMWTRDEIITAREHGAHVVPIVQNGAKFVSGIFGDQEWIPFEPGHISDSFMKVLEAVHYIRRKKVEDAISQLG